MGFFLVIQRSSLVQIYTLSCVLFWGFWNKRSLKKWFFPPLTRSYQVNDKNNRPQSEFIKICINRQSTCITGFCCCFVLFFYFIGLFNRAEFSLVHIFACNIIILWWMLHILVHYNDMCLIYRPNVLNIYTTVYVFILFDTCFAFRC